MKKFNWVLNALTLMAMALALVMAPMTPASADPSGPVVISGVEVEVEPAAAGEIAKYVITFQIHDGISGPDDSIAFVFPDGTTLTKNLETPPGDPFLAAFWIEAATTEALLDTAPYMEDQPYKVYWRPTAGPPEWPDNKVLLFLPDAPVSNIGTEDWVRVTFYGPPTINPGFPNTGIKNPEDQCAPGVECYCLDVNTSDEQVYVPGCYEIEPPLPVRLYRKYQIPLANSGYTFLDPVKGFTEIQPALDAANGIWLNKDPYTDEPFWNLFQDCPDLSNLNPFDDLDGKVLAAATKGVAIGAVIVVNQGTYTGTLNMNTPGVILASREGRDITIIEADGLADDDACDHAVDITAGGITLGESEIKTGAGPNDIDHFYGFTIRNAGYDVLGNDDPGDGCGGTDYDGVYVKPDASSSSKCGNTDVYSNTLKGYGVLTTTNFTITTSLGGTFSDTLVFTDTALLSGDFLGQLVTDTKLANLTTGWSGHISETWRCTPMVPFTNAVCVRLKAGLPDEKLIEVSDDRFGVGDAVAVFTITHDFHCPDARVDIRDNVIHHNTLNGIEALTTALWVDGNDVYDNAADGFNGTNLRCCGVLMVQDGINRTDAMLEISDNLFHGNGDGSADDWLGDGLLPRTSPAGCFDPFDHFAGDDSGIQIVSTLTGTRALADTMPLYIHDNDVYTNVHAGVWLDEDAAKCGIRMLRNDILDNGVFGVSNWANEDRRGRGGILNDPEVDDWFEPTDKPEVDVIFKYNDVLGNGYWGVKNWANDWAQKTADPFANQWTGPMFNAKENFWNPTVQPPEGPPEMYPGGPDKGPEHCRHTLDQQSDALGYGDDVCKGTFYNPWLARNWEHLIDVNEAQGMRAYGSYLELQAGWNTLAVPFALDDRYDTLADFLKLGTYLDRDVDGDGAEEELVERLYEYDNTGQGFQQDPEVDAVHGYYIKIDPDLAPDGTRFPVIYNIERGSGLPYYDLTVNTFNHGWNLVGAPFGLDKDWDTTTITVGTREACEECFTTTVFFDDLDDQGRYAIAQDGDFEAKKWAGEVLESVVWGADFANGAAMVVNPGMPGQIEPSWVRTIQDIMSATDDPAWMYTGEAYWVFMREPATMAGFELTPLYLPYQGASIPLR